MRERVHVIGARRKRQGIGGYVAREFAKAGAEVVAVVGSTAETAREAAAGLVGHGIVAAPWQDLAAALEAEDPDIVAICSPFRLHRKHLELDRPFCKPLVD